MTDFAPGAAPGDEPLGTGGFRFDVKERAFLYDRLGLRIK